MAGRSALARASNESAAKDDDCHHSALATPYPVLGGTQSCHQDVGAAEALAASAFGATRGANSTVACGRGATLLRGARVELGRRDRVARRVVGDGLVEDGLRHHIPVSFFNEADAISRACLAALSWVACKADS